MSEEQDPGTQVVALDIINKDEEKAIACQFVDSSNTDCKSDTLLLQFCNPTSAECFCQKMIIFIMHPYLTVYNLRLKERYFRV